MARARFEKKSAPVKIARPPATGSQRAPDSGRFFHQGFQDRPCGMCHGKIFSAGFENLGGYSFAAMRQAQIPPFWASAAFLLAFTGFAARCAGSYSAGRRSQETLFKDIRAPA